MVPARLSGRESDFPDERVALVLAFVLLALPSLGATEDPALRTVSVRVAADEQYRAKRGWQTELRAVVGAVSSTWERRHRVRWEIGAIVPWTSPPDLALGPLCSRARLDARDVC